MATSNLGGSSTGDTCSRPGYKSTCSFFGRFEAFKYPGLLGGPDVLKQAGKYHCKPLGNPATKPSLATGTAGALRGSGLEVHTERSKP